MWVAKSALLEVSFLDVKCGFQKPACHRFCLCVLVAFVLFCLRTYGSNAADEHILYLFALDCGHGRPTGAHRRSMNIQFGQVRLKLRFTIGS